MIINITKEKDGFLRIDIDGITVTWAKDVMDAQIAINELQQSNFRIFKNNGDFRDNCEQFEDK